MTENVVTFSVTFYFRYYFQNIYDSVLWLLFSRDDQHSYQPSNKYIQFLSRQFQAIREFN